MMIMKNIALALTLLLCLFSANSLAQKSASSTVKKPNINWLSAFMKRSKVHKEQSASGGNIGYRHLRVAGIKEQPIEIIGVPFSKGQNKEGTTFGPDELRNSVAGGLVAQIKRLGYKDVHDSGDLKFIDNPKDKQVFKNAFTNIENPYTVGDAILSLTDFVAQKVKEGRLPITIGGDHSLTVGSINGHARVKPNTCVIYIDAHGDINTCEGTRSGHIHGMTASFILKEINQFYPNASAACGPGMKDIKPSVSKDNFAYLALRDLDDHEMETINKLGILHFSMKDFDEFGVRECVAKVLKSACKGRPIHVSFDIDSLDILIGDSTGTPVNGGLTMREALIIGEMISDTGLLSAFDLFELNPKIGRQINKSRYTVAAVNILLSYLGKTREALYAPEPDLQHYTLKK